MKHATLLLVVLLSSVMPARAADVERYLLKEDTKLFGFIPGHTPGNAEFVMPFDKPYQELSASQKRILKSAYVEMGEADEPPYPIGGLRTYP